MTEDTRVGLHVFAKLTAQRRPEEAVRRWLYWLKDTPLGDAPNVVAKHRGEVVGFMSLMPVQMRIGGQTVRGAKAEFLVVRPEYRREVDDRTGLRLPIALSDALYRNADRWEMECVQSSGEGARITVVTGARPIEYGATQFSTVWSRPELRRFSFGPLNTAVGLGAQAYTSLARATGTLRLRDSAVAVSDPASEIRHVHGLEIPFNALFAPDLATLSHRFGEQPHLVYVTRDSSGVEHLFVFTEPGMGRRVRLKHWSPTEVSLEALVSVFRGAMTRCHKAGASSLEVTVPDADSFAPLRRLGFVARKVQRSVCLYCPSGRDVEWSPTRWSFTDIHTGLISL